MISVTGIVQRGKQTLSPYNCKSAPALCDCTPVPVPPTGLGCSSRYEWRLSEAPVFKFSLPSCLAPQLFSEGFPGCGVNHLILLGQ